MYGGHTSRTRPRYWLHALLLLLTLATTTVVGTRLAQNFERNLPAFNLEADLIFFLNVWRTPAVLKAGLPFSLTLLAILLAHEMGHYIACVRYGVDASLPYFLPAPTLIGTFGAFIRVKSPIFSRQILFDIGVAGPLAGFVLLLPLLLVGLAMSKVSPGVAESGDLIFGTPAVLRMLEMLFFPGVPARDIYLHPVARAAWVGLFATALNLLPIGQLDGGHILYSVVGDWHRALSKVFAFSLIPLGIFYWYGWLLWAVIFFLLGMRRPSIYDESPLSPGRLKLALLSLVILMLTFSIEPIRSGAIAV